MNILCGNSLGSKTDEDVHMYIEELYSSSISCRLYRISSWNDIEQELPVFIHICE